MAYTLPNLGLIRADKHGRNRVIHRRAKMTIAADGTASEQVKIPGPGRIIAVTYGGPNATESRAVGAVLTSGALTAKADTTAGVQIFTDADLSSVVTRPVAVGTAGKDETSAAIAATDGFSGGFPVRQGVFLSVASGTEAEVLVVDLWFKLMTYYRGELVSQSGADGSGAETAFVRIGNAGVLSALAMDFTQMPSTTDITIRADGASGNTLFTSTDSNTDIAPTMLGAPGAGEDAGATAATDGTECPNTFVNGLHITMAQADAFTSGDEKVVYEFWIDD
jgi:hypothetical protein